MGWSVPLWSKILRNIVSLLSLVTVGAKILTEDDACHGSDQTELLLEVLGTERDETVDNDGIKRAIQHDEHERTIRDHRLDRLPYS